MPSVAPSTDLPLPALVELSAMNDGLGRWIRLRLLRDRAAAAKSAAPEEMSELDDALADALPGARNHAKALRAFYEKNAAAVNALLAESMGDESAQLTGTAPQKALAKLGDDPAAGLAAQAAAFETHEDPRCTAILMQMLQCYASCQSGVESSCGSIWGEIYEKICM